MEILKKNIQQYQQEKFPALSKSMVEHGKKYKALITEKEKVLVILNACYKKASSKETFYELLKECKVQTYTRGGKMTGVVFGKHKFRFKRLGYAEERLEELDKSLNRNMELRQSRSNRKEKLSERDLEQ